MTRYDLLYQYTDLNEKRLEALRAAADGSLRRRSINGAMRQSMSGLIDKNMRITPLGQKVLVRANKIVKGALEQPHAELDIVVVERLDATMAVMRLRLSGMDWLTTKHLKTLRSLAICPEQTWEYLSGVFEAETLEDLQARGLLKGEARVGEPQRLTPAGNDLLMAAIGNSGS